MANGLPCKIVDDAILIDNNLKVSFRRTIRVPDNNVTHFLPPDLGTFPLERISQYASKLPKVIAEKDRLFFPMYQKEAMWIDFECKKSYLIKIYVGGVNVVSGELAIETSATELRRRNKYAKTRGDVPAMIKALQDYIVVPEQPWLDGIATTDGTVRQFVVMPHGNGYSVEAQITGVEVTRGLQSEVTPFDKSMLNFCVKIVAGQTFSLWLRYDSTIKQVKEMVEEKEGRSVSNQQFVYSRRELEGMSSSSQNRLQKGTTPMISDERYLSDYSISNVRLCPRIFTPSITNPSSGVPCT
jgi:hypothetical protein